MPRIALAALAVLLFAWPAVADANTAVNGGGLRKCVRVIRHVGADMLQNGCAGCRLVSVQRTRPGAEKPTAQTLTVPKKAQQPLPFRGPGQTRITAERPCPGTASELRQATADAGRRCVRFIKNPKGGAALINPCKACRAVKVEFVDTAGNRTHRAFAIAARSPVSFQATGLAKARILTDAPCG